MKLNIFINYYILILKTNYILICIIFFTPNIFIDTYFSKLIKLGNEINQIKTLNLRYLIFYYFWTIQILKQLIHK